MAKLLLIIPAYNEAQSIMTVIQDLRNYQGACYDFIVVNDGSADKTSKLCREANVPVIDLPFNQGLAGAFQAGMHYAYDNGYDYVMQFDADGQHRAEYIEPMLRCIEVGGNIAIGSRYLNKSAKGSARSVGIRLIRALIWLTTGKRLTDPTSGMRIYSRKTVELYAKNINYGPEPDTIAYLIRNGVEVREVPVKMQDRIAGKSYLSFFNSIKYMCRISLSILLIQFVRPNIEKEI